MRGVNAIRHRQRQQGAPGSRGLVGSAAEVIQKYAETTAMGMATLS